MQESMHNCSGFWFRLFSKSKILFSLQRSRPPRWGRTSNTTYSTWPHRGGRTWRSGSDTSTNAVRKQWRWNCWYSGGNYWFSTIYLWFMGFFIMANFNEKYRYHSHIRKIIFSIEKSDLWILIFHIKIFFLVCTSVLSSIRNIRNVWVNQIWPCYSFFHNTEVAFENQLGYGFNIYWYFGELYNNTLTIRNINSVISRLWQGHQGTAETFRPS